MGKESPRQGRNSGLITLKWLPSGRMGCPCKQGEKISRSCQLICFEAIPGKGEAESNDWEDKGAFPDLFSFTIDPRICG